MAHVIKLGSFKKHKNSTAQPNTAGWAEYNITLKGGADLKTPTVTLSASIDEVINYNYAVLFGRYYYIVGRAMERNNFVVLELEADSMANYKTDIGNTPLYILRSSTSSDGYITDNFYPPTADATITTELQDLDTVPLVDFNSGYYLLSVMGAGTSAGGAEFIYQLTPSQFKAVIRNVFNNINGFQLTDAFNSLIQAFGGNPQELISGVVWVPYHFPAVSSSVLIGGYNTGITAEVVTKSAIDLATFSYTIPKHPKAATRGKYLNTAPYSMYTLAINCGGIVQLDSSKLVDVDTIYVDRSLDVRGEIMTEVKSTTAGKQYTYAIVYGRMGVPISLNGNNAGGGVISGITSTITNALAAGTGNPIALANAFTSGIGSVAASITGSSSNVSNGSLAGISTPGRLMSTFYDIVDEDNTHNGRPLCIVTTPATLGGYMIAEKGEVEIDGLLSEQDEINNYIETGFYYE